MKRQSIAGHSGGDLFIILLSACTSVYRPVSFLALLQHLAPLLSGLRKSV